MITLRIPLLRRKLTLVIKLKSLGDLITQRRNKMNRNQLIAYTMKYGTKAYVNFKEGDRDTVQGLLYYSPNEDRLFVLNTSSQYQGSVPERDGGEWKKYGRNSWVLCQETLKGVKFIQHGDPITDYHTVTAEEIKELLGLSIKSILEIQINKKDVIFI
jgi:hypothetical protein|nr:MAG TPA: hypothetical protein [Crassvirales sp.]